MVGDLEMSFFVVYYAYRMRHTVCGIPYAAYGIFTCIFFNFENSGSFAVKTFFRNPYWIHNLNYSRPKLWPKPAFWTWNIQPSSVSFIRNKNLHSICLGDAEKIQFQFSTWNTDFGRRRRKIWMGRNQVIFLRKSRDYNLSTPNERFDGLWRSYICEMKMYDLDHLYSWACLIPYRVLLSWLDLEPKFVLGF